MAQKQQADLSLHDMTRVISNSADALHWQDILDKLNAGEMPPEDEPQPLRAELARWLVISLKRLRPREDARDTSGKIALRRLNRRI